MKIRIARDFAEVESLRDAWSRWPGHRDSEIDFYLMILRSYPEVLRPHVIALYRNGQPEAILIGRLEQKKLAFRVGYLTLFRHKARCLEFVYDGLRGNASPENTEILVREVMNCLRSGEADLAILEFVRIDSVLYQFSKTLPGFLGRDTSPSQTGHESLKLPPSIDELYKRMSSKRRSEIRRKAKKFVAQASRGYKHCLLPGTRTARSNISRRRRNRKEDLFAWPGSRVRRQYSRQGAFRAVRSQRLAPCLRSLYRRPAVRLLDRHALWRNVLRRICRLRSGISPSLPGDVCDAERD
jgi:hypothetical protein